MKLRIKSRRAEGGRMEVEGKHGQRLQWLLVAPFLRTGKNLAVFCRAYIKIAFLWTKTLMETERRLASFLLSQLY